MLPVSTTSSFSSKTRPWYQQAILVEPQPPVIQFDLHSPGSMERVALETYIASQYKRAYRARISSFMPSLLSMNRAERFEAAVGVRPAQDDSLFLETYLDKPVEQEIGTLAKRPVDRRKVIEVGNLVATAKGGSQLLFVLMTAVLDAAGFQWFVFTATPQVEKLIKRLHFCPYPLAYADAWRLDHSGLDAKGFNCKSQEAENLNSSADDWGSYYDSRPKVMAGDIAHAMAILRGRSRLARVVEQYQDEIARLAVSLRKQCSPLRHCA